MEMAVDLMASAVAAGAREMNADLLAGAAD